MHWTSCPNINMVYNGIGPNNNGYTNILPWHIHQIYIKILTGITILMPTSMFVITIIIIDTKHSTIYNNDAGIYVQTSIRVSLGMYVVLNIIQWNARNEGPWFPRTCTPFPCCHWCQMTLNFEVSHGSHNSCPCIYDWLGSNQGVYMGIKY